jgi:hypothetical protein
MKKIILCFFGVIPRSIKYTFQSIKENIIDVLKENNYEVEIYVFNLNIKDTKIDNVIVDQNDISIIPFNYFEEEDQSNIDNQLKLLKSHKNILFTRYDYGGCEQNCLRQMYSEYRVGLFLEKNVDKYDIAIVCGPDFYIANKINITEIENSFINNHFYTTVANEGQGYTNGFYFGKPNILVKPLKRIEYIEYFMPAHRDYEYILQQSIEINQIVRNITSLMFFKIRAGKGIFFRTHNDLYIKIFSIKNFNCILQEYYNLIEKLKII